MVHSDGIWNDFEPQRKLLKTKSLKRPAYTITRMSLTWQH